MGLDLHCGDSARRAEFVSLMGFLGAPGDTHRRSLEAGGLVADRYRIAKRLGQGSASDVYLVFDQDTSGLFALKVLRSTRIFSQPSLLEEARLVGRIGHPGVCRIFDALEHDGLPCLLMEYVDGDDLATLLIQVGRISPPRVHALALDLSEALGCAHDLGIVHRDLKPSNVLIDRTGRAKIIDFGIAAAAEDASDGITVGTPLYMPPELLDEAGAGVSPRCDVYALATVLYEAATGRVPFSGSDLASMIERKRAGSPVPPSRYSPGLDAHLESAILEGLACDPSDRPESARAFAERLGPLVELDDHPASTVEQRVLTVLALGLVGRPTAPTSAVLLDSAARVISGFGGHLASLTHDSILAYFGFPSSREDHADCAIRAARELLVCCEPMARAAGASLCIGVKTGDVRLERVSVGPSHLALGVVPGDAVRLRQAAKAGEALVSPESLRCAREPVAIREEIHLDESEGEPPSHALRLATGLGSIAAEVDGARTEPPLVGRAEELARLERLWASARAGRGRTAVVIGAPGIGKSRLMRALRESLQRQPLRWIELHGSRHHRVTAFAALHELADASAWFRIQEQDRIRLREVLAATAVPPRRLQRSWTASPAPPSWNPSKRADLIHRLATALLGPADGSPAVLVCEDTQWFDPSTLEVIAELAAEVQSRPVLLLATLRDESVLPWRPDVSIELPPLDHDAAGRLIDHLEQGEALPRLLREKVIERGEGIPLFLEVLARDARHGVESVPLDLRGLLQARIERAGPDSGVARIAACIGDRFSEPLLASVLDCEPDELEGALDRLCRTGIVRRHSSPATWAFAHAMLAEVARETLPEEQRCEANAAIAWALAANEPELVARHPELLATHLEQAGLPDAALEAWKRAGQAALSCCQLVEAQHHFENALALVSSVVAERRVEEEILLRTALARCHSPVRVDFADLPAHLERIEELLGGRDDPRYVTVLVQLARHYHVQGLLATNVSILDALRRSVRALERQNRTSPVSATNCLITLYELVASFHLDLGDLAQARRYHEKMFRLVSAESIPLPSDPIAQWALALGAPLSAWRLWHEGQFLAAQSQQHRWIPRLEELPAELLANSATYSAITLLLLGDLDACRDWAQRALGISIECGLSATEALSRGVLGARLAVAGNLQEGAAELRTAVNAMNDLGMRLFMPYLASYAADALVRLGRLDEADELLAPAMACASSGTDRVWEPELHRSQGGLLARSGDAVGAERSLRRAVSIARERKLLSLDLRATTDLAGFLRDTNRRSEALSTLAPVCAAFEGEFETPDLRAARQMLASR